MVEARQVDMRGGKTAMSIRHSNSQGQMQAADLQTVAEVIELEKNEKLKMGFSDHVAALVTAVVGSMFMVWVNLAWFVAWISLHETRVIDFDPYPFGLLTRIVSLAALFFSLFVLIAQ